MYWVWVSEQTADDEAMIYGPTDFSEEEDLEFDSGLIADDEATLVDITRDEHSQGVMADNVNLLGSGGLMFSSKLRQVLTGILLNIQYFPVVVKNLVDGSQTSDYNVANIVGRVSCLDRENSVLQISPEDEDVIEFIEVLAIDEASANSFDLFRLHEEPEIILASTRVKEACESNRITGVRFYEPCDYEF